MSFETFEQMFGERELLLLAEASAAEQRGDVGHALACLRRTPRPVGNPWENELIEMTELGDAAEPWQWARFAIAAAGRWVKSVQSPLVARVLREIPHAAQGVGGPLFPEYSGWVSGQAAVHRAVEGMLLFDELMLEVFLVQCAPALDVLAGGGRTWADTPGRVYELMDVDGAELHVRDHVAGEVRAVRHLGETVGLGEDDLVYGHLIGVPGEPGLIFAAPPVVVGELGAQRLERLGGEWPWDIDARCAALGAAVRSGDPYGQRSAEPGPSDPSCGNN